MNLEQAWAALQATPSYVEQQAALFAAEATPSDLAFRRKVSNSYHYYHQECGRREHSYVNVCVEDCAPETVCCGCWGMLHEAPRAEE